MSDKHVVAALQRSVADLELRLREVARERDEAYDDRRRARAERDLVRSAWAGAEDSLVAEREHAERLTKECDEARKYAQACEWALEAEQEYTARLKADLALECQEVAERQREACVVAVNAHGVRSEWGALVRATPLVTEGEP